jgi:type II secretion system protein N
MRAWLPRAILYLLFFLASAGVFFVAGFPAERLDLLVNARLAKAGGGALRVEGSHYRFPFSLAADRLTLATGARIIELGRLTATPSPLSLAGKAPAVSLVLEGEWGRVPIRLVVEKAGPWRAEVAEGRVDLGRHPALASLPLKLTGEGAVRMSLSGVRGTTEGLTGQGELLLARAAAGGKLLEGLGVPSLGFSRVVLPWSLDRGVLAIREGKVDGDLIGTVSGISRLAPQKLPLSSLDFTVALRPAGEAAPRLAPVFALLGAGGAAGAPGAGGITLRITGTAGQPAVAVSAGR